MALMRWSPMREIVGMQDQMNRLMRDFFGQGAEEMEYGNWIPAADLKEEENQFTVSLEVPGMKKEDIEINMENNVLTVRGERKFQSESQKENYHRIERAYGKFSRSFSMPTHVNSDAIAASYKDGMLEIVIPKAEESKPKRIAIKG
ncbi:MAG: Hsp20/alpha crystallin family protein [Acidobacteriota bacterium]|jgi:HSP20 family protein